MKFGTQTFTILPALFFFLISSYFALYSFQVADSLVKQRLLVLSLGFFLGGSLLSLSWFYSWVMSGSFGRSKGGVTSYAFSLSNLVSLLLIILGSITLVWVGHLTWHDITVWNKDIALIFFGSRTGESISLGMGMKVVHYVLVGLSLLLPGSVMFLRRRLRKCPHHFGYLASCPKKALAPKKCLVCPYIHACADLPQEEKPLVELTAEKEEASSKCSHHFGYLRSLPNNRAVPQECTACQKLLECKNPI